MATSKTLQKPQIIELLGSTIRVAHPDISRNYRTQLVSPIAVSGTAMSVTDNQTFSDDRWFLAGEVGDQEAEENDVNGAVTHGTSVTVTNTFKFAHDLDTPITLLNERGFKLYGAATDGGAGTLIASVDAITTPIADAVSIQWSKQYSEWTMISTDTVYAYYYVKFSDGVTDSAASDYIPSTGWSQSAVWNIVKQSLSQTNSEIGNKITNEFLILSADDAQKAVTQFMYQDPSGRLVQMDWDFENSYSEALTVTTNEPNYSLSSLNLKYQTDKGIQGVKIGDSRPIKKLNVDEYDSLMFDVHQTQVATQATAGQTTLVVDSLITFSQAGTIYINGQTITYTGISGTNTFTGIPASGTGMITSTIAVDSNVWQNISPGFPDYYTVDRGTLKFNRPPSVDYSGFPIKIRFIKALTALTELSDQTEIAFVNALPLFINSAIEDRKGNLDKSQYWMKGFKDAVMSNCLAQRVPSSQSKTYYNFGSPEDVYGESFPSSGRTWSNSN